ncbi:tetratricopeptide repeat-containing sensor histidine kinase [Cytophagaceae bacterium YF14B1]|uniref:histidine kinase n=1 Tax=Xanthocytophaga flava TaxID=3048013 RepID=A0AAE3QUY3_9BACT|nr:tetratricopeptide repeat-containing sensor histidine kinase [Xanthocytophaga flavus]MDJ1485865.1 tetratricopeptide repeat-containing sensor histidine kinase [Xanthocytophaga flavus]
MNAQNTIVDSLQTKLADSTLTDSVRIESLNYLSREYAYISASQGAGFAQSALELSLLTGNKQGEAYAYRNLASMYAAQESFYFTLEFVQKAIHLFEQIHDTVGLGNCYMTLGVLYKNNQSYAKAINYHNKALVIFQQKQLAERTAICLYNLGDAEFFSGKLQDASIHAEECIRIYQSLYFQRGLMLGYRLKGSIHFRENQLADAARSFHRVLQLYKTLGKNAIKESAADAMIQLSRIAHQNGQAEQECNYLKEAFLLSKNNIYSLHLRTSYQYLSSYYLQKKNFPAAQQLLDEYTKANDDLIVWQNRDKAAMVGSVLDALKLSNDNQHLVRQHALKQEVIEDQKQLLTLTIVISTLLCLVCIVVLFLYLTRRKLVTELLKQKDIIHEKSQKLEENNAAKDKFFKIIAHDMVSPLNSMSGLVNLLAQDMEMFSPKELQSIMDEFSKKLHNTLGLANNLIIWAHSQMQASPPEFSVTSVAELVEKIKDTYGDIAQQKQIDLHTDIPPNLTIYADPNQIEFVLRNLVNNAIKFTSRQGCISIYAEENNLTVILSVEDNGQGMTIEKIEDLFKLDNIRQSQGTEGEKGTGMGLVLCQEFIRKNNGKITVKSQKGAGSTFSIHLPQAPCIDEFQAALISDSDMKSRNI